MYKNKNILYPIISLLTVVIQGTIFVSAKVLINERLPLVEILLCRFILAYSCIWIISHGKLWANCPKDELLLFLAGLCGFSVFYCREHSFGNNTDFQYMPGTLQHNRKNQNHLKKTQ